MIDLTQIIIAIIGIIFSFIGLYILPEIKSFLKSKLSEKQINMILTITEMGVKKSQEEAWELPGSEKRKLAIDFVKQELAKYNITIDEKTIESYISSAVETFIRVKEIK